MKKWLWIIGGVLVTVYFAKQIISMLIKLPIIGSYFATKKQTDFTV
jgi:hypothetical protein